MEIRGLSIVPEAIVYHKISTSIVRDSPVSIYYGHRNLEWVYFQNMPWRLMLRTICAHTIYDAAAFLYFTGKGAMAEFVKAKWHALKGFKKALAKCRRIQAKKSVDDAYLWGLLERERFLPRLTMRFGKNRGAAK